MATEAEKRAKERSNAAAKSAAALAGARKRSPVFREQDAIARGMFADIRAGAAALESLSDDRVKGTPQTERSRAEDVLRKDITKFIDFTEKISKPQSGRVSGFGAFAEMGAEVFAIRDSFGKKRTPTSGGQRSHPSQLKKFKDAQLRRDAKVTTNEVTKRNQLAARRNLQIIPGAGSDLRARTNALLFPSADRKGALT